MSRYKLTPLEELRLEKKQVRENRSIAGQQIVYQLKYVNDNWGTLLTKGISSSIKTKLSETVDNISASSSVTPFITKKRNPWLNNTITQIVISNLPLIGSVVWRIAKPALIAFGTRKITSTLFSGRKKKEK